MADISLTTQQLSESLLFYRRDLARTIALKMLDWPVGHSLTDIPFKAEEMANAIIERLEARETGKLNGYGLKASQ